MRGNMVGIPIFSCTLSLLIFCLGCGGKGASTTTGELPPPPAVNLAIMPSGWTDRQQFLSIWNKDCGLIVVGGNSKNQPEWSNFVVDPFTFPPKQTYRKQNIPIRCH